jgi:hypothetical protein
VPCHESRVDSDTSELLLAEFILMNLPLINSAVSKLGRFQILPLSNSAFAAYIQNIPQKILVGAIGFEPTTPTMSR